MERLVEDMIHDAMRSGRGSLEACRAEIDFFLHVLAGSKLGRARFEHWWNRLERLRGKDAQDGDVEAWQPTTSSYLARFLWTSTRRPANVPDLITEALERVKDDPRPLLHAAMRQYATQNQWDVVSAMYRRLTGQGTDFPAPLDVITEQPFTIPPHLELEASRGTYTVMLQSLCSAGHLVPTLIVLQDMLKAGHATHLHEYHALFRGFAAWGVAAPINGSAWSLFPSPDEMQRHFSYSRHRSARGDGGDLTRIWATGVGHFGHDEPPHISVAREGMYNDDGVGRGWRTGGGAGQLGGGGDEGEHWTYDLLRTFFASFLALKPDQRGVRGSAQAPGPDDVYFVLLAFSRVSGGDEEIVWDAWSRIRAKFVGSRDSEVGHEVDDVEEMDVAQASRRESWTGWKMSNRLERVVAGLERRMKEKEEGLGI
jgi:hypothetical protein